MCFELVTVPHQTKHSTILLDGDQDLLLIHTMLISQPSFDSEVAFCFLHPLFGGVILPGAFLLRDRDSAPLSFG